MLKNKNIKDKFTSFFNDDEDDVDFTPIRGFRSNIKLKKAGEIIPWTKEMIDEYQKCANDIIYFAENYYKIVHIDRGLEQVKLYKYQIKILKMLQKQRYSCILQARQSGKTSVVAIFFLWYILFNKDKTTAIIANKGATAREILSRIQLAYENLPKWIQQGINSWNKGSIELENGCKIVAAATSSSAIRGMSIAVLYIDECVSGDTVVCVRDKITKEIKILTIEELYNEL